MIIKDIAKQGISEIGNIVPLIKNNIIPIKINKTIEIVVVPNLGPKNSHQDNVGIVIEENVIAVSDVIVFDKLSRLAKDSFKALGGKSLGRIDIKMDHFGIPHFIEANLMPGLRTGYFFRSCVLNLDMSYEDMIFSIANTGLSSR